MSDRVAIRIAGVATRPAGIDVVVVPDVDLDVDLVVQTWTFSDCVIGTRTES